MRILYGVTGCGLGHTMRARAISRMLEDRGHFVKIAASGRAVEILAARGHDVMRIDGMDMRFAEGGVRRGISLVDLARQAPRAVRHNAEVAWNEVRDFDPEALITDFDTFTCVVGVLLGRPVISVDHQHVIDRFRHPSSVTESVSAYRAIRTLITAKTPRCEHYVVSSFFFPDPRWSETTLVGPIIRPEVLAAKPTLGDHVLVYQTAMGDSRLLPALAAVPNQKFVVYGHGQDSRYPNIEVRPFDEGRFVEDLASSRAVIANGGFTTLSEAVCLEKPVLSIPLRRQTEQELNAAWLDHLGYGMRGESLDPSEIRRFLERLDDFRTNHDPRLRSGTADALTTLDRVLAEAA